MAETDKRTGSEIQRTEKVLKNIHKLPDCYIFLITKTKSYMNHLLRKALLLPIVLLVSCVLFAQQKTVTGKVVDTDGKPVPGVNVGIKGSTKTTTTNADGNFSIVVSS